jgi:ABC-2 type transport system ATP-binding protein
MFSMKAIKTVKLTKRFNGLTAVDSVGLEVKEGELFGLLGPNGAGKTTTIKMLTTLLIPTGGSAEVWGHDVSREPDAVRRSIGIVFQEPAVESELTGRENLDFHARMYGMNRKDRERSIDDVLELVELKDRANVLVKRYSGGMKRRLEIARGLMHWPKVLFLDEPTLGLDAQTRRSIWDYIKALKKKGVTIILTTHYMEEADYLCDRVAIIDHGKIMSMGSPSKLKDSIGSDMISVSTSGDPGDRFHSCISKLKWVKGVKKHDNHFNLEVKGAERRIPELMRIAEKCGTGIRSVTVKKPTLEDVFLKFTGRAIRDVEEENAAGVEKMKRRMRGPL